MKTMLLVVGSIIAAIVLFIVCRLFATIRGRRRVWEPLHAKIRPVVADIQSGRVPPIAQIEALAARPDTRNVLFYALRDLQRPERFPSRYRSIAAIGESDLVTWLMHPNELGAAPDEIEAVQEIVRQEGGKNYRFVVFRFRANPPHRAAKDGWLAGVAGPYWEGEEPIQPAPGVFSRFEPFDSKTPEAHYDGIESFCWADKTQAAE